MDSESISFDLYHPKPLLLVISGPSGVGKDTVVQTLRRRESSLHFVVTTTSRKKRPNEVDGVDYNFVTRKEFKRMVDAGEMLEYALVYRQYKGVPKKEVRDALASGKDVIMRVDVQGAATIRSLCPEAVLIFLIPSSQEEWLLRLRQRHSETEKDLRLRIRTARKELARIGEFDYVVVNAQNCLDKAVDAVEAIIEAEHHRVVPRRITL